MGYTHYFTPPTKFTPAFVDDVRALLARPEFSKLIQREYNNDAPPVATDEAIRFNGIGRNGHETLCLTPGGSWAFCKTARKPYDVVVCAVLLLMWEHHDGTWGCSDRPAGVSSDGLRESEVPYNDSEGWYDAAEATGICPWADLDGGEE